MSGLHDWGDSTLPRDISSHDIDNAIGNALCNGVVGASKHFRSTDGNIELGSQFFQAVDVDVWEWLLKPVKIQTFEFAPDAQGLFVGVGCDRICHQLEIGSNGFAAG